MYVITYVRRVSLLSLGCPSWYEEDKLKKNTLTKSVPHVQLKRNDTLLCERIDLGQKYDAWLTDQVPDVTNRLKRLHVSVDHGGLRPTICWFYQGVRLFAHYVMLCFMYLISYFTYGTVCMYVCMYVLLRACAHGSPTTLPWTTSKGGVVAKWDCDDIATHTDSEPDSGGCDTRIGIPSNCRPLHSRSGAPPSRRTPLF